MNTNIHAMFQSCLTERGHVAISDYVARRRYQIQGMSWRSTLSFIVDKKCNSGCSTTIFFEDWAMQSSLWEFGFFCTIFVCVSSYSTIVFFQSVLLSFTLPSHSPWLFLQQCVCCCQPEQRFALLFASTFRFLVLFASRHSCDSNRQG